MHMTVLDHKLQEVACLTPLLVKCSCVIKHIINRIISLCASCDVYVYANIAVPSDSTQDIRV